MTGEATRLCSEWGRFPLGLQLSLHLSVPGHSLWTLVLYLQSFLLCLCLHVMVVHDHLLIPNPSYSQSPHGFLQEPSQMPMLRLP